MQTLQDLIEEAKLRTVWWAVCIFAVTYFLTHTSKSMWMNVPIAILLVSGAHIILTEVDFHWKIRKSNRRSYLSHLEKKQLSVNDSRLNTLPPPPKWKRKIDSPVVESAMDDFTNKILQEFVLDLWYSDITPDKEAPQLIHAIIMDIFAEISLRVKDINLVDMLTRDVVDLVGDHLELFRKNQAKIGREVMGTLSSEERDERIKHHLMKSKELHPALLSPESEYKFLKRIMGALLAAVLRPREAQCPLVRCITRELLTCLIMEPVMRLMSPGRINELIEGIFLATNKGEQEGFDDQFNTTQNKTSNTNTNNEKGFQESTSTNNVPSTSQKSEKTTPTPNNQKETIPNPNPNPNPSANVASGPMSDWARAIEAATQRRTEVLQPENLENMWTRGRNYMKKSQKNSVPHKMKTGVNENSGLDTNDYQQRDSNADEFLSFDYGSDGKSRKSTSASESNLTSLTENIASPKVGGTIIQEFYSVNTPRNSDVQNDNIGFDNKGIRTEGYVPKLRCRVLGAFFEKSDSKSFAVYSIAVTDADNKTWFVKRRYRNFEKLHRHLKDIPNYTLHLPPKRIFSSSTEDAFVHQRCIQLDKYLKELLSTANLAEQHEVWDFLSLSSKSYSFGRSSSVAKPLAVNVDDAVDDIVRQFKGGLIKKVPSGSSSSSLNRNTTWDLNEQNDNNTPLKHGTPLKQPPTLDMRNFFSDYEEGEKDKRVNNEEMESVGILYGGNLDNEVKLRGLSPKIGKSDELNNNNNKNLGLEKKNSSEVRSEVLSLAAGSKEDPLGVPAEWAPPNVSVPLLNLVDKMFQLNRRGWLRRQVFWMSKQILQLMMEDAIDDWLLRQIQLLRRDELVAQGIRWIQDILWPEGIFFTKVKPSQTDSSQPNDGSAPTQSGSKAIKPGSFEEQLEATRRASDIKKMMLKGAPTTLVSLIGRKQYKRCAKDMYYFLQSAVCLKQLTYGLLELVLITVFPELQEIISNIHKQKGQEL